jgi:hypothetical protein
MIPKSIKKLTKLLPPWLNIGKGTPTTGASPIVIAILILIYKNISIATATIVTAAK